jgi:hypothetical protein
MARAHVVMQASSGEEFLDVQLDVDDFLRLNGRSVSVGSHGYAQVWMDRKVQTLHRWLFGLSGKGYSVLVDHLNRDRLDNRRENLRLVDGSLSNANRPQAVVPGVNVYRTRHGRYQVKFKWRGQVHYLGTFADQAAAEAHLEAYRRAHCPESIPPGQAAA